MVLLELEGAEASAVEADRQGQPISRQDPEIRRGLGSDWKKPTYGGPCPPIGRHRYFHKLYALDREVGDLGPRAGKPEVRKAPAGDGPPAS